MAGENDSVDDLVDTVPDSELGDAPPADPPADPPPGEKVVAPPVKDPPPAPPAKRDVPLATFLEEKRKFTEALNEERAEREKLRKELEALKNPPKPAPKYEEDPKGFIEHATKAAAQQVLDKLEETNKGIEAVKTKAEQDQERDSQNQFMEELATAEDEFIKAQPDYHHALAHVRGIAFAQMKEFYPDATEKQILAAITQQEIQMAAQAVKQGRNPHELAYRLAIANGYKKADPPPAGKKPAAGAKAPEITPDTVLDPDLSLGKSNGEAPGSGEEDVFDPEKGDVFDDAIKEIFGRKRA